MLSRILAVLALVAVLALPLAAEAHGGGSFGGFGGCSNGFGSRGFSGGGNVNIFVNGRGRRGFGGRRDDVRINANGLRIRVR